MASTIFGKWLDHDSAAAKGEELVQLIERDIRDRSIHMAKRQYTRNVYFGTMDRKLRYKGQSNIHLPVVAEKVEIIVPKLNNAMWNAEPHVNVQRLNPEFDRDETDGVERHMNWALETNIPGLYDTMDMWHRNMLLDSVSVVKAFYNVEHRNTVVIKPIKLFWEAGQPDLSGQPVPEPRQKTPAEILATAMPQRWELKSLEQDGVELNSPEDAFAEYESFAGMSFRVDLEDMRQDYFDVLVEFHESRFNDEVDVYIYRPVVHYDRVEVEIVEYEDLIVPYRTSDLQTTERVVQQYWLTYAQIEQKIAAGEWRVDEPDLEAMKNRMRTGERQEEHPENKSLKQQKDRQIGEDGRSSSGADKLSPYADDKILIFEVYARDDINGDGIFEEVIYQIPYATKHIVQAQYLEEVFPHGRRPFSALHSVRISDRFYGWSLGEMLTPINVEVNTILNLVNEAQEIINNPFFFYVPAGISADPQTITDMRPGRGVPVADINSVLFPKFMQEPLSNLQAMDSLLLFADRLTVSPQSGGSNQTRNAPRTARGTLALLSEAGVRIDSMIIAAQKGGWRELMHQIHALYAAFGPEETYFHVTGEKRASRITREEMQGRFEFTFSGNSVNTNREVMRSIAQTRFLTLLQHPLYAMDPRASLALIDDFLRWFGEGSNKDQLMPKIPEDSGAHPPLGQGTETQMMMRGKHVSALPTDDHARHMQELQRVMQGSASEQLESWQVALLAVHFSEHARMLVTQDTLAAGAGRANNVPNIAGQLQDGSGNGGVQ